MPELPEVETIIQDLRAQGLIGLKIERATIFWKKSILGDSSSFCDRIAHQTILDIRRRGKWLLFSLDRETLIVHLRMTGKFLISKAGFAPKSHERVRLYLSDQRQLHYEDQRKFGKWHLSSDPEKLLKTIGVEPLSTEFSLEAFEKLLEGRRRQIKPFLLDQHFVAGLGNIYADEALWLAKIHPSRSIQTLTKKEKLALHHAIVTVLKRGIKNGGTSLGVAQANYSRLTGRQGAHQTTLKVFRREGEACPRCQTVIQKIVLAQRGTHFCPGCQPIGET